MSTPAVTTPQATMPPTQAAPPQPIAARPADTSYAPDTSAEPVPVIFKDGTQGFVATSKIMDLVQSGDGEVAHHMSFPDGTQGFIPHENLAGALKDGGKVLDASYVRQQAANAPHETSLSDYGYLGAETALMTLGSAPASGAAKALPAAAKFTEEAAAQLPSGVQKLWRIAHETEAAQEVAGSKISAAGWKEFADTAYKEAADAIHSGDTVKSIAYRGAAELSKAYSGFESAWAWVGGTSMGKYLPVALRAYVAYKLAKDIGRVAGVGDSGKDEARDTLFDK